MRKINEVDHYIRILNEKTKNFATQLNVVLETLARGKSVQKIDEVTKIAEQIENLKFLLDAGDQPFWLLDLEKTIKQLLSQVIVKTGKDGPEREVDPMGSTNYGGLLFKIVEHYKDIQNHVWSNEKQAQTQPFDFEATFRANIEEIAISTLFDKLIANIQALIDSNRIDSIKGLESLEKLIASLKKSRKMNTFTDSTNWEYVKVFSKYLLREVVFELPVLKHILSAAENTIEEIDEKISGAHSKTIRSYSLQSNRALFNLKMQTKALPTPDQNPSQSEDTSNP